MALRLPERVFYRLKDIESLWGVSLSEIMQWILYGDLNACVWLPLSVVYQVTEKLEGNRIIQTRELCHKEGYMYVCRHDCRNLFRYGKTELRAFCDAHGERNYLLPDEGLSFFVEASELVILEEDRKSFEQNYKELRTINKQTGLQDVDFLNMFDPSFKTVRYEGGEYQFGDIQAAVLQKLYEAAESRELWVNGKLLLAQAGSQSLNVANVFKRNRIWRKLITSDGRGRYRLSDTFLASIHRMGG
ncbi:MAG: hypothetical protein ACSHX0_13310 [Akkermansiaceae bacterium]